MGVRQGVEKMKLQISLFSAWKTCLILKNIHHSFLLPPVVQFMALSLSAGAEINYKGNDMAGLSDRMRACLI